MAPFGFKLFIYNNKYENLIARLAMESFTGH